MATFRLDNFAPKITDSQSNFVNPNSANINDFDDSDFSPAGANKKQDELANYLNGSGQQGNFDTPFVGSPNLDDFTFDPQTPASSMPSSASESTNELKVIISQSPEVDGGPNRVVFNVMPRIDEAGGAEYEPITPVQHPGAIQKFRNSSPRTWNIQARLISRTIDEATENVAIINMIRSWRLPFHGNGTGNNPSTQAMLGAPPPILTLSAYGPTMIGPVKCVLTNYNWTFDNALDYVPTLDGNQIPVVLDISLALTESWSPAEFSGFDLVKFKSGDLSSSGAFNKVTMSTPSTQTPQDISTGEPTLLNPQDASGSLGNWDF